MKLLLGYRLGVWMAIGLGLAGSVLIPGAVHGAQTLVPAGAVWKYLDNGSDQGTAWIAPAFDDSGWASGAAQLGYGDGDEATVVGFGPDPAAKAITTYFRRLFPVTNTADITSLTVRLLRDDGGVVYLNGVEVFRSNMPPGPVDYNTLAASAAGGADESTQFYEGPVPPGTLVAGFNVLAVEIHQNAVTSSDLSFDLALIANGTASTNQPFTVTLVSPTNGARFVQPSSILLRAITSLPTNQPVLVEFFAGTNRIALDSTAPYIQVWSNAPLGNFQITAVATDSSGNFAVSAPANITVVSGTTNPPPLGIALSSPVNGATYTAPAFVVLNAVTTGGVARVDFFSGTNRIGQDFAPPYSALWSNVPPGNYQLTGVAVGSNGTSAVSLPVFITVIEGGTNQPFTVTLTSPTNGARFVQPAPIPLRAITSAPTNVPVLVEFYAGTNRIAQDSTAPYFAVWSNAPIGSFRITAVAIDPSGVTAVSAPANITVVANTNQPPLSVTLTSPTNGATFAAPAFIVLNATASGAVSRVEFYSNTNRIGQDFTAPYSALWSNVPPGNYQLTAVAVGSNGTAVASAPANITVTGGGPPGPLTLVPTGAVWKYLDNGTDQGLAWVNPGFDDSTWAVGAAQLGYGDGDEVTVVGFGPDPFAKYITTYFRRTFGVTNVGDINSLTVRLLRDDGGVVYLNGVEVFRSNMPDGPIAFNTLAPLAVDESTFYEAAISPALLVAGPNVVAVEIHQSNPASSDISFDLALVANANSTTNPPPVPPTIVNQPQSQTVLAGQTVSFSVGVTGTPPLEYGWRFNDNFIPGATNSVLTLSNVQPENSGNYSVAVSNQVGIAFSSNAVLQVLSNTNQPLTVTLTSPTNGARFVQPASIFLRATTTPTNQPVLVQFYAGTNRIGQDSTAPYVAVWSNAPIGNFQLTAVAIDPNGVMAVSAPVNITVTGSNTGALTLIQTGAVWKYLDDGTDQGSTWLGSFFDDSAWVSGPAQLGFGDGDEATVIGFGPDPAVKNITTYFRRVFGVTNTANITSLTVRLLRDDGGVVYLNGVEIFRSNMPEGPVSFNTLAVSAAGGPDESTMFYEAQVSPSLLVSGANVVAVEIHQNSPLSSDLSFDLQLVAQRSSGIIRVPPTIVTQPQSQTVAAGSTVSFNVVATGTPPLIYRWRKEGAVVAVTTNGAFTIFNVQPAQAGVYSVVVSNIAGMATSSNALLTVIETQTNRPPVAMATVSPRALLFPDQGGVLIISPNNSNALVVLDGSLSSDPDNDPLEYVWFDEAGTYAIGVQLTNILELGNYTFILEVDDGALSGMDSVAFGVITASEAVDFIIERVNDSPFGGSVRRPLIATLRSAQADFDAGEFMMGVRRLHAFQMKVQTRVARVDPALASLLVNAAQAVIDAVHSP